MLNLSFSSQLTYVGDGPVEFYRRLLGEVEGVAVGEQQAGHQDVAEAQDGVGDPARAQRVGVHVRYLKGRASVEYGEWNVKQMKRLGVGTWMGKNFVSFKDCVNPIF